MEKYNLDYETRISNLLEQLDNQRKELIEDEIKFLNLGKIKIEGKTNEIEFLIRQRLIYLNKELQELKEKSK